MLEMSKQDTTGTHSKKVMEGTASCAGSTVSAPAPGVFANFEVNNDKPTPNIMTGNIFNDQQLA